MKKKLVIIGANEFQFPLVKKANERRFETHVIAWKDGEVCSKIADRFYPVSITDIKEIRQIVTNVQPHGICSIATDLAVTTVCAIAEEFGLVGNSSRCATISTNKNEMRKAFKENNIPIPKFVNLKNSDNLEFHDMNYPVIVKPADRSGSRGVFKVESMDQLKNSIEIALEYSFEKSVMIEEYIEGNEYSVETISQNGNHQFLQITEKFTTGAPNFIEVGHLAPARLNEKKIAEIVDLTFRALDALEIKNGASHSELKIKPDGSIRFIEIGSRMGGDFIGSHMVEITSGVDFVGCVIDVALNQELPKFKIQKKSTAIVRFALSEQDIGLIKHVADMMPDSVKEFHVNSTLNDKVVDSSTRNGSIVLSIPDEKAADGLVAMLFNDH